MSLVSQNVRQATDTNTRVWTAPSGSVAPTSAYGYPGTGWLDVGFLSDDGITQSAANAEQKIFALQGPLVRVIRSQFEKPFKFIAIETNAVVNGLRYPGTTVTTTGGTAEVQTVTESGSATGGTWALFSTYGSATGLAYNIATSVLATTLTSAFGFTVTVTGTAGTSYVVTFPVGLGNVAQMTTTSALTGGSSPATSVATTTPGVQGTNSRPVFAFGGVNYRAFCVDIGDGTVNHRYYCANAEALPSGDITYSGKAAVSQEFTINTYGDSSGNFFTEIDNDPANGAGLYV